MFVAACNHSTIRNMSVFSCVISSLVKLKNKLGSEGTPSFLIIRHFPDTGQRVVCSYFLRVTDVAALACNVCFHYACNAKKVESLPTVQMAATLLLQ